MHLLVVSLAFDGDDKGKRAFRAIERHDQKRVKVSQGKRYESSEAVVVNIAFIVHWGGLLLGSTFVKSGVKRVLLLKNQKL